MAELAQFQYEPTFQPTFVNRNSELDWLGERIFDPSLQHSPIFVTGVGGVGKTSLVKQFLDTRRVSALCFWVDLHQQPSAIVAVTEFTEQLYQARSRDRYLVVVDGAEFLSDGELTHSISGLLNLKAVQSLIFISRRKPQLKRMSILELNTLADVDAGRLIKAVLSAEFPPDVIAQAARTTQGHPLTISLLGGLFRSGGTEAVLDFIGGRLYDVSKAVAVPEDKIVASVTPAIIIANDTLIEQLKKQPDAVFRLPPRKFEELLADLLKDKGWEVELTPTTRDGGKDILAYLNTDFGKLLCLVEAKKYRHDRKIGVDLVRTLYGTMCDHQANSAMLVTTSSFTPDAHDFQKRHEYQLALRDYSHLVQWIQQYKG
jgi:restriction system protein